MTARTPKDLAREKRLSSYVRQIQEHTHENAMLIAWDLFDWASNEGQTDLVDKFREEWGKERTRPDKLDVEPRSK